MASRARGAAKCSASMAGCPSVSIDCSDRPFNFGVGASNVTLGFSFSNGGVLGVSGLVVGVQYAPPLVDISMGVVEGI